MSKGDKETKPLECDENDNNTQGSANLFLTIYEACYFFGLLITRQFRGTISAVLSFFSHLYGDIKSGLISLSYRIYSPFGEWVTKQREWLRLKRKDIKECLLELSLQKENGLSHSFPVILKLIGVFAQVIWRYTQRALNYIAPVFAVVIFVLTINYFKDLKFALNVQYAGKDLGYIKDETVFRTAEQIIRGRTTMGDVSPNEIIPSYRLVVADEDELSDAKTLADNMLRSSYVDVVEASGLFIDDEFVGATTRPDDLLLALDDLREQFRGDDENAKMNFVQSITISDGLYPSSSVLPTSEFRTLINSEVAGEKYYTVEKGDAPSLIASEFDIPYSDFLLMNPDVEKRLMVGDKVLISRSVPFLSVTTTKREVYNEVLPYRTNYTYNDSYYSTYFRTTKAGVNGEQEVTAFVTYLDGQVVGRQVLNTKVLVEPVPREVTTGTKNPVSAIANLQNSGGRSKGLLWPVPAGGYISCGLWGYAGHTGIDITGTGYGSNIAAAASGTVVTAGWHRAYGYYIIINHGGGIQTLYAHCSALYVWAGQYVNQGDIIAAMGSTGNSSGNHLHFEVRVDGQFMNPTYYF